VSRDGSLIIPPDILLAAYRRGHFPMAESRDDDEVFWLDPQLRGIIPLDDFHLPRRLARTMRSSAYTVGVDRAFDRVIALCAEETRTRSNTWINPVIEDSYIHLFQSGHAHSVEVWDGEELVGGLYGVSTGRAFFGESMFSRRTDVSKMALVNLVFRLRAGGYTLLDTQFITEHLTQFGAREIPRAAYKKLLREAITGEGNFYELGGTGDVLAVGAVLQPTTQTS
jgi:leucyl/phenylalanyl-tRNA--protein transferase